MWVKIILEGLLPEGLGTVGRRARETQTPKKKPRECEFGASSGFPTRGCREPVVGNGHAAHHYLVARREERIFNSAKKNPGRSEPGFSLRCGAWLRGCRGMSAPLGLAMLQRWFEDEAMGECLGTV
jgi:hypothetical protein